MGQDANPANTAQFKAVNAYNKANLEMLKNPDRLEAQANFVLTVVKDSEVASSDLGRLGRYRAGGVRLTQNSMHITKPVSVTGDIVKTLEDVLWLRSDGARSYIRVGVRHIYKLEKVAGAWRVDSDDFDFDDGKVEWRALNENQTYVWGNCHVTAKPEGPLQLFTQSKTNLGTITEETIISGPPPNGLKRSHRTDEGQKLGNTRISSETQEGPDLFFAECYIAANLLPAPIQKFFRGYYSLGE